MERKGIVAASEKAASGWISVKSRLPDFDYPVLGFSVAHGVNIDYVEWDGSWFSFSDITHWMPLPEPPKDGE